MRSEKITSCALRLLFAFILSTCSTIVACDSPKGFDADYAKAEGFVGMGQTDKALSAYRKLIDRYPKDPRQPAILLRIGDLYASVLHDEAMAIKSYGRVIETYPLSEAAVLAHERRAHLSQKAGNIDQAIEDYSALLKHFPDHVDRFRYRVLLVGAYLAGRNFHQARLEIRPLLDDSSVPPDVREQALFAAGESFFLDDDPEHAVPFYQQLLKEFPTTPLASEAELHLATCVEEMGYLGTAREITKDAARDYPNKGVIDTRLKSIKERGSKPIE